METTRHAFAGEMFAVLTRLRGTATGKSASKNPNHHRQFALASVRRPNVKGEAIFALPRIAEHHVVKGSCCIQREPKLGSLAHAVPLGCRLRGFPTQWATRRRRKGDAQKVPRLAVRRHLSLHLASIGFEHQGIAGVRRQASKPAATRSRSKNTLR